MCAFSLGLAFLSYNLFSLAMANLGFLQKYGLMAVAEGGLLQLMQIGAKGLLALLCYLGFKGAETELIARWRRGQGQ